MRIAYLSRGNTVHDQRFLGKMVERGHEPHFISYHDDRVVEVPGVRTYHFAMNQVAPFPRFRTLQIVHHLRKLLKQIKPDILHSGWLPDHGFFGAMSRFHPNLSMAWGSDVLLCPQRNKSFYWRTRWALAGADHIIADAQILKKRIIELAKCGPEKVSIFPFGVEQNVFQPSPRRADIRRALGWDDREILIMTRNWRPVYGVHFFIEALARVVKQRPTIGVLLAGSGELEESLRKRAGILGLDAHVKWLGRITPPQMADYLSASDLYVALPLSDAVSLSLLEAMACGLPVVVSDLPANHEWVEEGVHGVFAVPEDVDGVAEKILGLLENPSLRQSMGKRNLALARERADWNHNFGILESLYTRLIDEAKN